MWVDGQGWVLAELAFKQLPASSLHCSYVFGSLRAPALHALIAACCAAPHHAPARAGQQGQGWQLLTAGAFVSMAVPLLVFVSLQRYFIRGMTSGAVKG